MDRNDTIELSNLAALGKIPLNKVLKIITDYCLEKNKSDRDISVFIEYLSANPSMLGSCLNQALEYFERKFVVCKLWSASNPLNNQGQERTLLQIF